MNTYGKKGGIGATRDRQSETIVATIAGTTYRKRVFFGQRFIEVFQNASMANPIIRAWHLESEAAKASEECRKLGFEFHAWSPAIVEVKQ